MSGGPIFGMSRTPRPHLTEAQLLAALRVARADFSRVDAEREEAFQGLLACDARLLQESQKLGPAGDALYFADPDWVIVSARYRDAMERAMWLHERLRPLAHDLEMIRRCTSPSPARTARGCAGLLRTSWG